MRKYITALAIFFINWVPAQAANMGEQQSVQLQPQPFSTHAEWNQGFLKCEPQNSHDSRSYTPGSGWAIVQAGDPQFTENNNGGGGISLAQGGPSYPGVASVTSQFDLLLGIARAKNNVDALKDIRAIRDAWLKAREGLPTDNAVNYWVWANSSGSCQDQKGGSVGINFLVTVRYVGNDNDLTNVVNDLRTKYFPDI